MPVAEAKAEPHSSIIKCKSHALSISSTAIAVAVALSVSVSVAVAVGNAIFNLKFPFNVCKAANKATLLVCHE